MALINFHQKCHRLINTAYPPIGIFDSVADASDAQAAIELEMMTSDRHTDALGRLKAIPKTDWAMGAPGANYVMASFAYSTGGRFNGHALGAWYATLTIQTAIQETVYHNTKRLRHSEGGFPNKTQMRELISSPSAKLEDICSVDDKGFYHENDYSASQKFGESIRESGQDGIVYKSVRDNEGKNIVLFRPRLILPITQGDHYDYVWDKDGNVSVSKITNVA